MRVTKLSPFTETENTREIDITPEQLSRVDKRFETGEYIQHIVPHLSGDDREFLLSGYTPEDWATMFPPEEKLFTI